LIGSHYWPITAKMEDNKSSRRLGVLKNQLNQTVISESKTASSIRGRDIKELTSVVERDLKAYPNLGQNLTPKQKAIKWNGESKNQF
jgi:hypothetical protein